MKILKIFGLVVGIHVFALVLIFANPGCSSITKPAPVPSDTAGQTGTLSASGLPPTAVTAPERSPISPAPVSFNPDAPAAAAAGGGSVRFMPTRPGTPVAGALVAEPVTEVVPATTYVVKSGDNLWSVAKKFHLTPAALATGNNLATTAILHPGQKLLIPSGGIVPTGAATPPKAPASATAKAPDAAAAAARSSGESVKHVVKSGETLGTIARYYGVRQGDIAVANNIADPAKIKAGTELTIPGFQVPPGKAGKGASKAAENKSGLNLEPLPPPITAPPSVPIIRIDDTPITPAPKP